MSFQCQMLLNGMLGEHDFLLFKSGSNRSTSVTTIKSIEIEGLQDLILIDIKATGFLYGMVRSIVGQLVLVGEKKISPEIFKDRWKSKNKMMFANQLQLMAYVLLILYMKKIFLKLIKMIFFQNF